MRDSAENNQRLKRDLKIKGKIEEHYHRDPIPVGKIKKQL